MGLAAFVLGFIGWTTLSTTDPTLRSDRVAVLYRTVQLFIGEDGGIFSVPWTLDIARIIAPLVIPLLGSVAVLGFAAKPLNRLGARTAVGHTVAVGPADRVGIHLSDSTDVDSIEVHADGTDSPTLIGPMHVQVDLADPSWLARTSAPAARRIVIATGRDDENLQLLQHALDAGVRGEIDVETATSESQRWLAIALAESHPDADVRVFCLEASQRRSVVSQITSDSRLLADPSAPCAVIGDAADIAVLASDLARELAIAHPSAVTAAHTADPTTPLGTSRRFFVVGADDIDAVIAALDAHRDATAGLLHLFVGTHTVDDVARLANLVALVADDDSATAVRTAAQLASSRLDTQIFVRAADLRDVPLPRVTVIDSDAESLRAASPDPVQQLARVLYEAKNTGPDAIEWSRLRRDVRSHLVRDVKRLVTELPAVGFVVTAGHVTDDADLPRDEELDLIAGVLANGGPVSDARREDAANLAHQLARTGLRLTRAGATWPARDEAVDVLRAPPSMPWRRSCTTGTSTTCASMGDSPTTTRRTCRGTTSASRCGCRTPTTCCTPSPRSTPSATASCIPTIPRSPTCSDRPMPTRMQRSTLPLKVQVQVQMHRARRRHQRSHSSTPCPTRSWRTGPASSTPAG